MMLSSFIESLGVCIISPDTLFQEPTEYFHPFPNIYEDFLSQELCFSTIPISQYQIIEKEKGVSLLFLKEAYQAQKQAPYS